VACPAGPITALVLAVALAFLRNVAAAQPASVEPATPALTEVGFDSGRWTFYGGPATPAVAGRDTAWAVPGVALLRGVTFEDGVIEVDVSPGFPALVFHAESSDEYETVYLRTPSSGRADALQYSPVHRRFLPWRLYHDGQAPATFTPAAAAGGPAGPAARTHVRAVVEGRAVRVYVNRAATPSLVATLRHPARGGAIGVWSMAIVSPAMQYAHFRYAGTPAPQERPPTLPRPPSAGGRHAVGAVAAAARRGRRRLPGGRQRAPVAAGHGRLRRARERVPVRRRARRRGAHRADRRPRHPDARTGRPGAAGVRVL
jgi:hypothetical protein